MVTYTVHEAVAGDWAELQATYFVDPIVEAHPCFYAPPAQRVRLCAQMISAYYSYQWNGTKPLCPLSNSAVF